MSGINTSGTPLAQKPIQSRSAATRRSRNRFSGTLAALFLSENVILALVVWHVFHTPGYVAAGRLPLVLPWALGINVAGGALILSFAWRAGWRLHLQTVLCGSVLLSGILFFLPRALRLVRPQQRLYAIGLIYAVFLLALAVVVVWFAVANVQLASRRFLRVWIAAASMLVYAGTTGWMMVSWQLTGDEPHYLLLTYSLVHDHDFDLTNNYAHQDYHAFFQQYMGPETVPGRDGTAMLWHDVGLPLLITPGYAWAGWTGAMLTVNLVTSLLALGIFEAAVELGASAAAALLVWGLFAFSAPLIIYNSMLYPETAGAAGALWAAILFSKFSTSRKRKFLWSMGILVSVLPWLCIRYWMYVAPLLIITGLFILFHRRPWWRADFTALVVPLCLSAAVFSWFDFYHFGTPLPNAGYLRVAAVYPQFTHVRPLTGLLGILFDRLQGLIPVAPIYLWAFAGLLAAWKQSLWRAAALSTASISYLGFMACSQYWTGGGCPPARYALGAAALWAPAAALVLRRGKRQFLLGAAVAWSAAMAIAFTGFPMVRALNMSDLATPALDLLVRMHFKFNYDVVFPSLIRGARSDYLIAGLWVFLTSACVWLLNRGSKHEVA